VKHVGAPGGFVDEPDGIGAVVEVRDEGAFDIDVDPIAELAGGVGVVGVAGDGALMAL
jgi:hypothetical protein